MERWWFHMIAGPDGSEQQVRLILRVGEDPSAFPTLQVRLDGTEVPVDDASVDYEAPEWKALQLYTAGSGAGADQRWEALKDRLRAQAR
ncbi:MAG: hypothetical protein MUF83_10325 [Acidimicrobiales bacterium]|jgi:hypothetical protein|nr:hypothetical protein [Acidimicrobiales bacterium]